MGLILLRSRMLVLEYCCEGGTLWLTMPAGSLTLRQQSTRQFIADLMISSLHFDCDKKVSCYGQLWARECEYLPTHSFIVDWQNSSPVQDGALWTMSETRKKQSWTMCLFSLEFVGLACFRWLRVPCFWQACRHLLPRNECLSPYFCIHGTAAILVPSLGKD